MKRLPLPLNAFHLFIHKVFSLLSFADVVEGDTDEGDDNNIDHFMGFLFLLWLQVF